MPNKMYTEIYQFLKDTRTSALRYKSAEASVPNLAVFKINEVLGNFLKNSVLLRLGLYEQKVSINNLKKKTN